MSEAWSLHPQLERDTTQVGDLVLSRVLAINDADYPWLILVPRRPGAVEIAALTAADAARLMEELALASRALRDVTACDKLNIAAIGNIVPQLHVHIVARWKTDPLWPRPVWGHAPVRTEPLEKFHALLATVRAKLGAALLAS
jgi:diadenosine tetraphosphate (Ap4A) HIT family hydrolase